MVHPTTGFVRIPKVPWSAITMIMDYFMTTLDQRDFYSPLLVHSEQKTGLTGQPLQWSEPSRFRGHVRARP